MKKSFLYILIVSVLMINIANAGTIVHSYNFSEPVVQREGEYDYFHIPNCRLIANPGEPVLPVKGVQLLLPPAEEAVDVNLDLGERLNIEGNFNIKPFQQEYPLSYDGDIEVTPMKPEILDADIPFPAVKHGNLNTEFYAGHGIAFLPIYPVEYSAKTGEVWYYPNITVTITTQSTSAATSSYQHLLKVTPAVNQKLANTIQNPSLISSYGAVRTSRDSDDYDYLIITNENLVPSFQPLADYKNQCGILTQIHTVEDIYDEYSGQDNPEKIRNFIIDEYQNHNITYLLLGGDADTNDGVQVIPHRGMYVEQGFYTDSNIPTDIYYSSLDGTWNDDGDGNWGEPNEDDLMAELYVGRATVDNATEADNFINKVLMYQQSPVIADIEKAQMVGEDLGWSPWGKDYKEEIRLGSSNWGYTTVGFPDNFTVETLYDKDAIWNPISDLLPIFNDGRNLVNHLGHALNNNVMKFYTSDINDNNFTNDGVNQTFHINYSQGCYCGSFDNRGTGSSYQDDAITEKWTTIENGAVAFICNSRYGWGNSSNTNGSSQYYDREFFDALFGENISKIGEAQQDSKEDCIWAIDYSANRWCYYCCNLFGEPTMNIWTETPEDITVNHIGVYQIGMPIFDVSVFDSEDSPIENARVAMTYDGEVVGVALTDASGLATLELSEPIVQPGDLTLSVTAHNILDYTEDLAVVAGMAIEGYVKDSDTDQPVYANVYNESSGFSTTANAEDGFYRVYMIDSGNYILKANLWGYEEFVSDSIYVAEEDTTEFDIYMTPLANAGSIQGIVTSSSGEPVEGAMVTLVDTELLPVYTDASGEYEFSPLVSDYDYEIEVHHNSYEPQAQSIHLNDSENATIDFTMAYIEIFEETEGGFSGEADWEWGTPTPDGGPETAYSGTKCWGTNLDGDYSPNQNMYAYSSIYCLINSTTPSLIFYTWYDAQDGWDGGNVRISTDEGENWDLIYPDGGYPDNSIVALTGQAGYTGESEGWIRQEFDLTPYADMDVQFAFRFATTNAEEPGWFFDNFTVNGGVLALASPPYFSAEVYNDDVTLTWTDPQTNYELDGFNLYRKASADEEFGDPIQTFDSGTHTYVDHDMEPGDYSYGITAFYTNGMESNKELRDVTVESAGAEMPENLAIPKYYSLGQNYPNPFNPTTEINYAVPKTCDVSLRIYNLQGQLIRTLVNEKQEASYYSVTWSGKDDSGNRVNSGVYLYKLDAEGYSAIKRMVLLK